MLQGTFSSCPFYCFQTLELSPCTACPVFPREACSFAFTLAHAALGSRCLSFPPPSLLLLSQINRHVRLTRSGHLIFLKLSALSFDLAGVSLCIHCSHHLRPLLQNHGNCCDFFLVSRSQSVSWGNIWSHFSACFHFFPSTELCFLILPVIWGLGWGVHLQS